MTTSKRIQSMREFAKLIVQILKSDRYCPIVCSGEMGEGKSCFTDKLAKEISKLTKLPFSYQNNMTYLRSELRDWIETHPERSVILADEFISLFFKRNWYQEDQIEGIELLNKCRDRHLVVIGNIPNFWDLDSAIYSIVRFWVHIHERGRAWIIQKSSNPWDEDKWNKRLNRKSFEKEKNPYKCKGFVCEIHFDDWEPEEKKKYYEVRNIKRKNTEGQKKKRVKYKDIKEQRNNCILHMRDKLGYTHNAIAEIVGLSRPVVSQILEGEIG